MIKIIQEVFRISKVIFSLFWTLLKHNPIKTIWINFKCLPFAQAKYLPILLYGKTQFRSLEGQILLNCDNVRPFMIKIGKNEYYVSTNVPKTIWTIKGKLILSGPINFLQGTYIMISPTGTLKFGTNGTFLGSNSIVICRENIEIGNRVELTWNTQIYDTSFHYVRSLMGGTNKLTQPIKIGDNVWIGNNTTISKGSVIPDNSIVCSHSLVNKDLSEHGNYCMFAGIPAVMKKNNVERVWDEKELDLHYNYVRSWL